MGQYLITVTFEHTSGLPADRMVNTFAVKTAAADSTAIDIDNVLPPFGDFYNLLHGTQTARLCAYMSQCLDRGAGRSKIRAYAIPLGPAGGPMGSPLFETDFQLASTGLGGKELPSEVAAVISYHADLTNIPQEAPPAAPGEKKQRPANRRRGRLYIGPLNDQVCQVGVGGVGRQRIGAVPQADMAEAFKGLFADVAASGSVGATLAVFSRKDHTLRAVTGGFVDDGFDTQRRRGEKAVSRTVFNTP